MCEKHFAKTHRRNDDGRYVVTLPFKDEKLSPNLGDSRKSAIATLFQLEKRFEKNQTLRDEYKKFIDEYIQLGHMELVPFNSGKAKVIHYFPHHCVFKQSTTTKLRVVFGILRVMAFL